jgi:hypothetical protein
MKYMVYDSRFRYAIGPFDTKEGAKDYIERQLNNTLKTDHLLLMEVIEEVFGLCDKLIED